MYQLNRIWSTEKKSKKIEINCVNCFNFNLKDKKCLKGYSIEKIKLSDKEFKYIPYVRWIMISCEYGYRY